MGEQGATVTLHCLGKARSSHTSCDKHRDLGRMLLMGHSQRREMEPLEQLCYGSMGASGSGGYKQLENTWRSAGHVPVWHSHCLELLPVQ